MFMNLCLAAFLVAVSASQTDLNLRLGPFNLSRELLTESRLVQTYGNGLIIDESATGSTSARKHVYYVLDTATWVVIGMSNVLDEHMERSVEFVMLTKQDLGLSKREAKQPFGAMTTREGILLGMTMKNVVSVFGEPQIDLNVNDYRSSLSLIVRDLKQNSGRVIRYVPDDFNELGFIEFYFKDDKLHSIVVSAQE